MHLCGRMTAGIPVLDNRAFLARFGEENAFFSTIDFTRFTIVPLELAWVGLKKTLPFPPVRSTNHDFIFITGGSTQRMRGIDTYTVAAGEVLFMPAYQVSRVLSMTRDVTGFFVNFSDQFLTDVLGHKSPLAALPFWQPDAPAKWTLPDAHVAEWAADLRRMVAVSQGTHPEREALVAHLLMAFFWNLKPFLTQKTDAPNAPMRSSVQLAEQFRQLLRLQFDPHKSLADYAALLHVTPNHLNKCVRSTLGKTCSELLAEHRLLEARVLLGREDLSLGAIAEALGFADLTHFGRFFRQKTGVSPSRFRHTIDFAE
jgi:AraC family transcriptional regulator, transcriptional activator of pobA